MAEKIKERVYILALSLKYEGDWSKIWHAIERKLALNNGEIEAAKEFKGNYITLLDENYPQILKHIHNPPFVLYYKGNIEILNNDFISVVGTREPSKYGLFMTEKIVKGLNENGYGIISGLAVGIDSKAHQECLNNKCPTIAIVANGLECVYPKSNIGLFNNIIDNGGLILSEYPPYVEATSDKFGFRNRLVAALGRGLLVSEAYERSGTMITVKHALFFGKDVYVVPHNATSNTICNRWIKEGAILVENAEDILDEIKF